MYHPKQGEATLPRLTAEIFTQRKAALNELRDAALRAPPQIRNRLLAEFRRLGEREIEAEVRLRQIMAERGAE